MKLLEQATSLLDRKQAHAHACLHASLHTCLYTCLCICLYSRPYICLYTCLYTRLYTCLCTGGSLLNRTHADTLADACVHTCPCPCPYICPHICRCTCLCTGRSLLIHDLEHRCALGMPWFRCGRLLGAIRCDCTVACAPSILARSRRASLPQRSPFFLITRTGRCQVPGIDPST